MEMLSQEHAHWLEERGIDSEIASRYGLYTAERKDIGRAIVFPIRWKGQVVNRKYRGSPKSFRQDKDLVPAFFNGDVVRDETLADQPLVITEGELDTLASLQVGFLRAVSVPNGADSNLEFLGEMWPFVAKVPRIILAADGDEGGRMLAAELARRLGAARCYWLEYPDGCKDLNDVLRLQGASGVRAVLEAARPYPVKGLYRLSDYPDVPVPVTYETGWINLNPHLKVWFPEFIVVVGIPGHGKSLWALNLLGNLGRQYGHRAAIASFEMGVVPYVRNVLREHHSGKNSRDLTLDEKRAADAWIEEIFLFVDQDPREEEEDADLEWMIDRAEDAVIRYGVRWLLIDPWNQVEHKRGTSESEADYQCRAIRSLKRFAKSYDCGVIVVVHPTKDVKLPSGDIRAPTLYDVSGSAHWYNAADHGIVISRDTTTNIAEISIEKSRYREGGVPGSASLRWEHGRFIPTVETPCMGRSGEDHC